MTTHHPKEEPVGFVIAPGRVMPNQSGTGCDDAKMAFSPASRRVWILLTLFFVTGAFGMRLLWQRDDSGPVFHRPSRWIWAIIVTLYTFVLIAGVVLLVRYTSEQVLSPRA
ncbi:MAG: hypothetical protein AAF745_10440 [Planctomycetota bacterium]